MLNIWIYRTFICIQFLFIPSDFLCNFPENLRGQFISAHKGLITFSNTTITGYSTTVPNLPVVSWECQIKDGNKYKMQAIESTATFGGILFLHLCLEIHAVSDNTFYYYLGTNRHSFAQDYVEGVVQADAAAALAFVDNSCNRAEPYNPGSFILLVRDGTVQSGNATIQCPTDLLAVFSSVNITNNAGTKEYCEDTTLDVCNDRTMLNYTYNDTCSTIKTYSAGGVYSCIYAIEDSGTTYLGVWNNDTTVDDSTTFRFTCYAFQKSGGIVYATEAPRFCNDSDQTSTAVGSINGGNIIELYDITQTCPDIESTTTQPTTTTVPPEEVVPASLDLLALLLLVLLIPLIILLIYLIKKYVIPKWKARKKKVVKKEPPNQKIDLGRGDKNAKKTFRLHSYQTDDTRRLVPLFKPKKPIKISPAFDPAWGPGSLPFLIPLPKVEPLYHDTLEDYLRARLPRRPSHLSLYSFDSVIFGSDPSEA